MKPLFVLSIVVAALLLTGCSSNLPDLGPNVWYRGTATVDPPDATVFGPPGEFAIQWQRIPERGLWIWTENRNNGWQRETVWEAGVAGTFKAMISSGAWEGQVVEENWGDNGIYAPGGWTYALVLTDKSGMITGNADTGGNDGGTDNNSTSAPYNVWIKLKWMRNDGTIGATMSQTLNECNEEEYLNAIARLGGQPPVQR